MPPARTTAIFTTSPLSYRCHPGTLVPSSVNGVSPVVASTRWDFYLPLEENHVFSYKDSGLCVHAILYELFEC